MYGRSWVRFPSGTQIFSLSHARDMLNIPHEIIFFITSPSAGMGQTKTCRNENTGISRYFGCVHLPSKPSKAISSMQSKRASMLGVVQRDFSLVQHDTDV